MGPLTFMSAHLIVMCIEALVGMVIMLRTTASRGDPHSADTAAEAVAAAAGAPANVMPSTLSLADLAALWQFGYVLSEPLLLSAELILATAEVAGVVAGGALAFIGCAAVALTYATALELRGANPPQWLRKALAVAIVIAAAMAMTIGRGNPPVAQGIGITFYLIGRVPLALLWVGVGLGFPCCCGEQIVLTTPTKGAGIGCSLFLLSLVMAGVDPDHKQWMALGWIMLPAGVSHHLCCTHKTVVWPASVPGCQ